MRLIDVGIAGAVTVYALGDMMIYNRRKRREYFAEQMALHNASVHEAQLAVRRGTATENQIALLREEEEHRRSKEAEQAPKPGIFRRSTKWLFSGWKKDEDLEVVGNSGPSLDFEGANKEDGIVVESGSEILKAVEEKKEEIKQRAKENETQPERAGGPLDRLGTSVATADTTNLEAPKQGGGWTAFMSRR